MTPTRKIRRIWSPPLGIPVELRGLANIVRYSYYVGFGEVGWRYLEITEEIVVEAMTRN
jgi:hypothetical protein